MSSNNSAHGLFYTNKSSGRLQTEIDERAILISNHQLYTDWIYLWWVAFTAKAHGGIYIMLKKSLSKIPLWGWGMQNYQFFFLSRSWAQDEKILTQGLTRINKNKHDPAWLLLFPEGTTISANGVRKTTAFSEKFDPPLPVPKNVLIPRARGLRFSIEQLHKTVEYVYDATIYYEGIPNGDFGEEFFSLKRMFLYNQYPTAIHMYWRRYLIADIPWQDEALFEKWLQARWTEKDKLLDTIRKTGQFQPVAAVEPKHYTSVTDFKTGQVHKVEQGPSEVEAEIGAPVKLNSITELSQVFMVPVTIAMILRLGYKLISQSS